MGWEQRNGRMYYYRKERVAGQVLSHYVGTGDIASLMATLDAEERSQQAEDRDAMREERRQWETVDRENAACFAQVEAVLRQTLESAGYHRHNRGEWRKRRGNQEEFSPGKTDRRAGAAGTDADGGRGR